MTATDEARKALIDMGCSCDVMHGYQCGLHGALTAYETIRDAEKREAGRREGLEQAAHIIGNFQVSIDKQFFDFLEVMKEQVRAQITATPTSSCDASHVETEGELGRQPRSVVSPSVLEASGAQGTSAKLAATGMEHLLAKLTALRDELAEGKITSNTYVVRVDAILRDFGGK